MNRVILPFIYLLLIFNTCSLLAEMESRLQIRAAAFIPSSNLFKKIYGDREANYQLEASTKMYNYVDQWANFDWLSKHGKTDGLSDPTKVHIATISLGLKFPYQLSEQFTAYIGIGPSLSRIWLKNKTECSHDTLSKLSIGGVLKIGTYYLMTEDVFIDIFVDYFYQPIHFETHINIGGIKTGLGLGVQF